MQRGLNVAASRPASLARERSACGVSAGAVRSSISLRSTSGMAAGTGPLSDSPLRSNSWLNSAPANSRCGWIDSSTADGTVGRLDRQRPAGHPVARGLERLRPHAARRSHEHHPEDSKHRQRDPDLDQRAADGPAHLVICGSSRILMIRILSCWFGSPEGRAALRAALKGRLSGSLLLEVRRAQRLDQPCIDEPRRVALVIEIAIGAELVHGRDRFRVVLP